MSYLKPAVHELVRVEDRISFLYIEFAVLVRDGSALKAVRDTGTVCLPTAEISALWLGPSVTVTHQAMSLLFEWGTTVVWVGEDGVACYGSGRSLNSRTRLLEAQARIHISPKLRLRCAREMYAMRFGEDAPSDATTYNALRGHEGARVRKSYAAYAAKYNVSWSGRLFTPGELAKSDPINQALTVAHHCLYAVVGGVVHGLGVHPGLSVVHNGTQSSFIYDIADLYKTDVCIPAAFKVVSENPQASGPLLSRFVRLEMRINLTSERVVPQAVKDIYDLLMSEDVESSYSTIDHLWDRAAHVHGGINYGR